MKALLLSFSIFFGLSSLLGAQQVETTPGKPWEIVNFTTLDSSGIKKMACATDSRGSIICIEFMWAGNGNLVAFFSIFFHDSIASPHSKEKLPVLIFEDGKVDENNAVIEWEKFLGNTIIPKFYTEERVTWQIQTAEFRAFTPENQSPLGTFYNSVRTNDSLDILLYLDNGQEIVSELSLKGLPPLLEELVAEAREVAPENARWVETEEERQEMAETFQRFDRKYGITKEGQQQAELEILERHQNLREKVRRLKQQQQQQGDSN